LSIEPELVARDEAHGHERVVPLPGIGNRRERPVEDEAGRLDARRHVDRDAGPERQPEQQQAVFRHAVLVDHCGGYGRSSRPRTGPTRRLALAGAEAAVVEREHAVARSRSVSSFSWTSGV